MPYFASPGESMIVFEISKYPPGLKRQLMTSGMWPIVRSRKSMCVMSSRLMVAPSLSARAKSSAGVSFEENMISGPVMPWRSQSISSVSEEQSMPQPSSCRMSMMVGLGVALTAKYSLKPLFHANASRTSFALRLIPRSS